MWKKKEETWSKIKLRMNDSENYLVSCRIVVALVSKLVYKIMYEHDAIYRPSSSHPLFHSGLLEMEIVRRTKTGRPAPIKAFETISLSVQMRLFIARLFGNFCPSSTCAWI